MKEKYYAAVMPFIGEVYVFTNEKDFDDYLAFRDDITILEAEMGEHNTERRISLTESDVSRLFMDLEPEIIKREYLNGYILFNSFVQHAAIINIKCRRRFGLDNVAPLTGAELNTITPMIQLAGALK